MTAPKKVKPPEVLRQDGKPHIISLGVGRPPKAQCTCGWASDSTEDLYALGVAAFDHRDKTGHRLRRPDDPD